MKVVNISLSPSVLEPESVTAKRISHYGLVVDEYIVLVPHTTDLTVQLADNVVVYGIAGATRLITLMRVWQRLRTLIKEQRCDVVATDQYFFGALGVYCRWRYGIALEVIALGFEKYTWLRKLLAMYVMKRTDSVRVNSLRLVEFIKAEYKRVDHSKIHLVPIYVDTASLGLGTGKSTPVYREYLHALMTTYGDRFNFLSVNRLVPAKNISLQICAMAELKCTHPEVCLHILGDGPLQEELAKEIVDHQLNDYVVLHGYVDSYELGAFYGLADCFLLTSDTEGWGMVTVEALTAQLPVIMTDVGAAGEVIIDGKSGMVIPVGNQAVLVAAMTSIMEDTIQRKALITGGQTVLRDLPTREELLQLYRSSWDYAYNHKHKK